jgi:crotonobetainyl-CoA:carnitine CoA-transferase CaiB-like acyl-CoA transferase
MSFPIIDDGCRPNTSQLPLKGLRALDLTQDCGQSVGRLLADLGVDVILVEPANVARDRDSRPIAGSDSFRFAFDNANKRGFVLDPEKDPAELDRLLGRADILIVAPQIDSSPLCALDTFGIRQRHPHLIVLSMTAFGLDGPYMAWKATGPTLLALSGALSRSGLPGREPLPPPGDLVLGSVHLQATFAVLVAYLNRLDTGHGDRLDFSYFEAAISLIDPGFGVGGSATGGIPASKLPRGRADARYFYPVFRCADGYIRVCILSAKQWQGMYRWLGEPAELSDPAYGKLIKRFNEFDRILPYIECQIANLTRAEVVEQLQRDGVPCAGLATPAEVLGAEHFLQTGAVRRLDVGLGIHVQGPHGLLEVDGKRVGIRSRAPRSGEHQEEIRRELATIADRESDPDATADVPLADHPTSRRAPLRGLKVLDFGVIVVGAELGRLLADQGADVIKIESRAYPDGVRQSPVSDSDRMTPSFAWGNRNKRGLGLNLRTDEGKRTFFRLAAKADVILSNFKPGTFESLGISYPNLVAVNPTLIMADSLAFGASGPWSKRMGYGPLVRASTGLSYLWRYPDTDDSFSDAQTIYPDHAAARVGAVGVLALLIRKRRQNRGGTVSVSQSDAVPLGPLIAEESIRPGSLVAVGNASTRAAPWGVYPCAGDDEWCVVTVETDPQWRAFCTIAERMDLLDDGRLATALGRVAQRARVDAAVREWTSRRTPDHVMSALQREGVAAAAMRRVVDLPENPQLAKRGFFRRFKHPLIEGMLVAENAPVRSDHLQDPPLRPAPLEGQHSREILTEILDVGNVEYERLLRAGVVEQPEPLTTTARTGIRA